VTPGSATSVGATDAALAARLPISAVVPVLVRDAEGTLPASGGTAGGCTAWKRPPTRSRVAPDPTSPRAVHRRLRDVLPSGGGS